MIEFILPLPLKMNNPKALVSILLPIHNSEKFLKECLASLRSQTYKNIEVIAIDDKSSDNSYKILKQFKKDLPALRHGKRFRISQNIKRYGIVMTLNRVLRKAKGEYIAFAGANDLAHKNRIKRQLQFLLSNREVLAVGTQCVFINKKGARIGKSKFPQENSRIYSSPLHGLSMQFESVMINKSLLPKDILKFDAGALPFIYSDFLIKLLPYGKFANLRNYLHFHRNNPKIYLYDLPKNFFSFIKLCLRSRELHDYQRAHRMFFSSLVRPLTLSVK